MDYNSFLRDIFDQILMYFRCRYYKDNLKFDKKSFLTNKDRRFAIHTASKFKINNNYFTRITSYLKCTKCFMRIYF